jgi:hypothetical protein
MSTWVNHQELYFSILRRVEELAGKEPAGLRRYRQQFDAGLGGHWQVSHRDELIQAIPSAKIIFIADFHALQQSQKAHLRLLKLWPASQLILAVEFLEARHQRFVNLFLQSKISEMEFLKKVHWHKAWGFPWECYRPILLWAREKGVSVYGINLKTSSLKARDQFAAKKIRQIRRRHGNTQVAVIFGDLHLAEEHLPKELLKIDKKLSWEDLLLIYQNSEKIYFELLHKGKEASVDVVKLSPRKFCLNRVAPWVKWQSYLKFLERTLESEVDEGVDYTEEVARYMKIIAKDLGLSAASDSFSIYSRADLALREKLEKIQPLAKRRMIKEMVKSGETFYLPEYQIGVIGTHTENHLATLAMAVLHAQISGCREFPRHFRQDFTRLIWLSAMQYFGSKFVNPKRTSATVADMKNIALKKGAPEPYRLALRQFEMELLALEKGKVPEPPRARSAMSYLQGAKILGSILGEKFYLGLRQNLLMQPTVERMLKRDLQTGSFNDFYIECLRLTQKLPEPFITKQGKL